VIGSSVHPFIGPFSILDFRLRQSEIGSFARHLSLVTAFAIWFIFSPDAADNRSGGVWAARMIVSVLGCLHFRPLPPSVSCHSSLVTTLYVCPAVVGPSALPAALSS